MERNYEVIGEAIRQTERGDPGLAEAILSYREIIDFRNRITHGYYTLDHARVWRYTRERLPELRDAVSALMDTLDTNT